MKPTAAQTADTLTHIEQLTARLRPLEATLRHRAADTTPDGYPRQSGLGAGHGQGGDPVGTTVALRLDHPHRDILGHAHTEMTDKLDQARRILEEAESTAQRALPPPTRRNLDDGCVSCARIKAWSPISRTRRCRFCSDWAYAHAGDDPPVPVLRARHEGRRVTVRLIETIRRS